MKKKISYIKFVKSWGLILLLSLGISIISIDVIRTYREFNTRVDKMRVDYIEQQKEMVKREANRFVDELAGAKQRETNLAKDKVKHRVLDAYNIVKNIYLQNKSDKTDAEIQKVIIDALREMRFSGGNGYYFVISLDGIKLLSTYNPMLEGTSILEDKDVDGKYLIKDMISIARDAGEGFYNYSWVKPGAIGDHHKKTSFIKLFEPYGWIVGAGFYQADVESHLQQLFVEKVSETYYGKNGYFFAHTWQGMTLAHGTQPELTGVNMWDAEDGRGVKLVQNLITVSQSKNGGYVKYWWRKPDTQEERPKITFALGLRDWQCYLATGVYLDDIDPVIADQQLILIGHIKEKLTLFITFITVTIILFLLFFNRVNVKLEKDLSQFITFFKSATKANKEIDNKFIRFSEFDQMANSANEMLRDKMHAEKMLEDEKEQLAVTLRSIADGVITTDTEGHVELMNTVAEELTGWCNKDAKGKMLAEVFNVIDEETREIVDNPVSQVLELGYNVDIKKHTVLISKDGVECDIADSAAPIRGADSGIHGVVLVFRDVTDQKKAENLLFNAKKLESIGILAGGIAHDFNNVLTGIFGNIELAKHKLPEDHEAYAYVETAELALERATSLTKQLLTFAKGGDPVLAAVSLQEVITASVKFNMSGSNVKVCLKLPDDLWQIKADKGQLNQVIANLSINAQQAMQDGGSLYIEAENIKDIADSAVPQLVGDFVKIVIRDEGCGISTKDLEKIFDPYFSTKQTGNGIGLATVRSIVMRHDGHINVDSAINVGTTFTIFWPVEELEEEEVRTTQISIPDNSESILGHILVMDDEELIQKISTAMLKGCGYTSDVAIDGVEALEKYKAAKKDGTPFDIVIMDLTIPGGMGGKVAIDEFLAVDLDVKVIVSSGYSVDPIMANYGDYGFKGRLVKPFRIKDIARELAHVMKMG